MRHSIIVATGSYIPPAAIPNKHFIDHDFYDAEGNRLKPSNPDILKKLYEIMVLF